MTQMARTLPAAVLFLFVFLTARAGGAEEPFQPPVAGKPDHFNGAVGVFRISTRAEPKTIQVEKPLLFTVRITATGKVLMPPRRPALESNVDFTSDFYVEKPPVAEKHPDERTWEFYYLLKPQRIDVTEIPDLLFCFFDPAFGQNPSGYQTIRADAIPVKVTLPPVTATPAPPVPAAALSITSGEKVLRRQEAWTLPGPAVLAVLLLGPPLACVAWYVLWRRLYPDVARQVRHRRSRAARQALQTFHDARTLPPQRRAEQIADAVALYLRRRLDLPAVTPTPGEAAAYLEKAGAPDALRQQAFSFFQACDTLRFAPEPTPAAADLGAAATDLVLAVETETWSSHPS
jgi:hypothetical protein